MRAGARRAARLPSLLGLWAGVMSRVLWSPGSIQGEYGAILDGGKPGSSGVTLRVRDLLLLLVFAAAVICANLHLLARWLGYGQYSSAVSFWIVGYFATGAFVVAVKQGLVARRGGGGRLSDRVTGWEDLIAVVLLLGLYQLWRTNA